ncbi:hypothetical protein BDV06DRAFT_228964 [Aspergillus oleicola]
MANQRPDPQNLPETRRHSARNPPMNRMSAEGEVNGVWNGILNWVIDPMEGYITSPQGQHSTMGGERGFSDFHTEVRDANGRKRSFLITQCKKPEKEGQESVWEEGEAQLQRYLAIQHVHRPAPPR